MRGEREGGRERGEGAGRERGGRTDVYACVSGEVCVCERRRSGMCMCVAALFPGYPNILLFTITH